MASNGALYGIIGALSVVVVGGGLYIAKQEGVFDSSNKTTAVIAPPAPSPAPTPAPPPPQPKPPVVAVPQPAPAPPPPLPSGTSQAEAMLAHQLVTDARQAIARGDLSAAGRALDQAERLAPTSPSVIDARRDLREAQQHARRDSGRVDSLVADARAAIARHDYVAASRLLDQAETIDRRDRDVQQARAELNAAQRPPDPARR